MEPFVIDEFIKNCVGYKIDMPSENEENSYVHLLKLLILNG